MGILRRSPEQLALEKIHQVKALMLVHLDLSNLGLQSLPREVRSLKFIKTINLTGNYFCELPGWIAEIKLLTHVDLSNNRLTLLPLPLLCIEPLEYIDLSDNDLFSLPEALQSAHPQLKYISVHRNPTLATPLHLCGPSSIWDQSISSMPNRMGLCDYFFRERLLTANDIAKSRIEKSKGSTTIDLSALGLLEVPDDIQFHDWPIEKLNLRGNNLTSLPNWFNELAELTWLDLSDNKLESLPLNFGSLEKLQHLSLAGNLFSRVPPSLFGITGLKTLLLQRNPALKIPPEVLGPESSEPHENGDFEAKAILAYAKKVESDADTQPLNEIKLIIVGRGGVGKTSLVDRLVNDAFDPESTKTEGIQINRWPLACEFVDGIADIQVNIWDFGGQEIMHATHQFFLTQRSVYLVVVSGREGMEDVDTEYWLRLIESFAGDQCPVIIALNKFNQHAFQLNERALRDKFFGIRHFVETDCRFGWGLDRLRRDLRTTIQGLPHVRDKFPLNWFSIKNQLSQMRSSTERSYMSFDEFRNLCLANGETDRNNQRYLARYLHNLGTALHYAEDLRLNDMSVIDPRWVTTGIYTVLNSPSMVLDKGELTAAKLRRLLPADVYPVEKHSFLLNLMRKFELCYPLDDEDHSYLIPELLPKHEPARASYFKPENSLNFIYDYRGILPEGLMARFIVKSYTHIKSADHRWRMGAILAWQDSRALVKADVQDRKIIIRVQGQSPSTLLGVIRQLFDQIHRDLRKLQPEELVPLPQDPSQSIPYSELLAFYRLGETSLKRVIGGGMVELNIRSLLEGVDVKEAKSLDLEPPREPLNLYFSYAQPDEKLRDQLQSHLSVIVRQGYILPWHDRMIEPGAEEASEVSRHLESADIFLFLVSSDFLESKRCYERDLEYALEARKSRPIEILVAWLRHCDFAGSKLEDFKILPSKERPVISYNPIEEGLDLISKGVRRAAEQIIAAKYARS